MELQAVGDPAAEEVEHVGDPAHGLVEELLDRGPLQGVLRDVGDDRLLVGAAPHLALG